MVGWHTCAFACGGFFAGWHGPRFGVQLPDARHRPAWCGAGRYLMRRAAVRGLCFYFSMSSPPFAVCYALLHSCRGPVVVLLRGVLVCGQPIWLPPVPWLVAICCCLGDMCRSVSQQPHADQDDRIRRIMAEEEAITFAAHRQVELIKELEEKQVPKVLRCSVFGRPGHV